MLLLAPIFNKNNRNKVQVHTERVERYQMPEKVSREKQIYIYIYSKDGVNQSSQQQQKQWQLTIIHRILCCCCGSGGDDVVIENVKLIWKKK